MKKFKNIYIEITNVCNLSCSFCPRTSRKAKVMSADEFAFVLGRVIAHTEYIYLHVVGEPLLNTEIDKILDCCDLRNAKIKLTTNGTVLRQNLDMLARHNSVKAVNISLSCLKDFDADAARRYLDDAFFAADFLSGKGITTTLRVWTDIRYFDDISAKIYKDFGVDILSQGGIVSGVKRIKNHLLFDTDSEFVWPIQSTSDPVLQNNCLGLRKQSAILSDGTLVPCCLDSDAKLGLGNIFESSLEQILSGQRATKIAEGFKNSQAVEPFCKSCTFSKSRLE